MKIFSTLLIILFAMNLNAQLQPLKSGVYRWDELAVKKSAEREARKIMEVTTNEFSFFEVHATTQIKGAKASAAHTQEDIEEVIIIKEGTLRCKIGGQVKELGPGSVMLIPPLVSQEFENIGDGPLTYYVFMFKSKKPMDKKLSNNESVLLLDASELPYTEKNGKGGIKYFDRATATTDRYEMHITSLTKKGPSHTPHEHLETEAILVINGNVSMMVDGKEFTGGAGDLFLADSGTLHGLSNADDAPCSYFAFKWK